MFPVEILSRDVVENLEIDLWNAIAFEKFLEELCKAKWIEYFRISKRVDIYSSPYFLPGNSEAFFVFTMTCNAFPLHSH